ncbi:SWIM zinc finger family protein [Streptomyces millisiae]|uniref:SWF or SNF family helicase n=1 Tax=Streptomyces millisiae TaxID=3075542 RepID=A0ABU2LXW3_9ACTN|nr:SWF or SNF family helicase [Streptomyces sp. DSM 44918]MDT0322431.1 SWF or SNF family helicase [Streptomyces sp. DSM 44918]
MNGAPHDASDDVPDDAGEELVFAALPPVGGRGFATTWWGRSWLKALEDTALDAARLRQGRRAARGGAVGAVSVRPGRLTAVVRAEDGVPYRSDVLLRRLTDAEWDRLLRTVAGEAGHLAALLDRDIPKRLVADAQAAGVDLLPGIGDLDPECECGEWDHCAHTAALCYQVARLLDADPFLLLLLRGRGERELTDELQRRSAAHAEPGPHAATRRAPEGEPAATVWAGAAALPPLPEPPPAVPRPGPVPSLRTDPPAGDGLDVAALEFLARDAARRAARLLAESLAPGHAGTAPPAPLSAWEDAVRLAAGEPPPAAVAGRLARGCGRGRRELEIAVRAWGFGGAAALSALTGERGTPLTEPELRRMRDQLAAAWADEETRPVLRGDGARWTVVGEGAQLRHDPEGRWWPYRKRAGHWWPAGPAERDPVAALAAARHAGAEDGRPVDGRGPAGGPGTTAG